MPLVGLSGSSLFPKCLFHLKRWSNTLPNWKLGAIDVWVLAQSWLGPSLGMLGSIYIRNLQKQGMYPSGLMGEEDDAELWCQSLSKFSLGVFSASRKLLGPRRLRGPGHELPLSLVRAVIFPQRQVPEIYQLLSLPLCLSRKHSTFSKNTFGVHTK